MLYSDINNKFVIDPKAGDLQIDIDIDAVKNSIENILGTSRGERVMLPGFGSGIKGILFEPLDVSLGRALELEIVDSINTWDDRVQVSTSEVVPDYDHNSVTIKVQCQVKGLGTYVFTKELKL